MPAVVSIIISKKLEDLKREHPELNSVFDQEGLSRGIPPEMIDSHGRIQIGGGSGFIVNTSGIVLTNKHVVAEPRALYTVITSDGKKFEADVLARDPLDDVAILKIKSAPKSLAILELGNSKEIKLGQTVMAFGNALGIFKNTVSKGIISGLSRSISAQADPMAPPQEMRGLIQTDAAINPGNSGGPLTNIFGEVIGINAAVVFGAQNIGFAIPIEMAERDLGDLKKFGRIKRPLLGLRYMILNPDLREKLKLTVDYGALVLRENALGEAVVPKSPADRAGLTEKDIILEWNGEKITAEKTIQDFLENCTVGEEVALKILRKAKTIDKKVILAERK